MAIAIEGNGAPPAMAAAAVGSASQGRHPPRSRRRVDACLFPAPTLTAWVDTNKLPA